MLPTIPQIPKLPVAAENRRVVKMARSQMQTWKVKAIRDQGGNCPVSGVTFDMRNLKDAVIDHDHDTGLLRGVLSRSANAVEGKVRNAVGRWGGVGYNNTAGMIAYLERLVAYLKKEPYPLIYPMHKTEEELRIERNKKERIRRAAKRASSAVRGTK